MVRVHSRRLILLGCVFFLLLGTWLLFTRNLIELPVEDNATRREGWRNTPAYAPGVFMAGQRPGNASACSWSYGLPEKLSYSRESLSGTPEAGESSAYRVLPSIIRGQTRSGNGTPLVSLTLCTHATADQVYNVLELVRRWEGPVSLAVYAPGLDAGLAVDLLERACRCEPHLSKLSVHLVFPTSLVPALGSFCRRDGDCSASDLLRSDSDTERKRRGMIYPINVARNVARSFATTARVLVSDIELLPSDNLASGFLQMIHQRPPTFGLVFVVPVFEIEEHERPPANKCELIAKIRTGRAVYFHKFVCIHCQRFPGMSRWMLRPDPGRVKPLIVTRREYPYHRWEPVYIGTRHDPLYNEDLSWEGRQDKMAQMLEMCLMNYRLIVLDGAFLVHSPGIKKKISQVNSTSTKIIDNRVNAQIYYASTQRLLKQYPTNPRCRQ